MSKKAINQLRTMQLPYKFGSTNPPSGARRSTITVDSRTHVLTAADSSATVFFGGSGIGIANLPPVGGSAGVWFEFMVTSVHRHIIQDTEGSKINGCIHHNTNGSTVARVNFSNASRVRLHTSNAAIGDKIRVWSDGTLWYVDGLVNDAVD